MFSRRQFLKCAVCTGAGLGMSTVNPLGLAEAWGQTQPSTSGGNMKRDFKISLAAWSLHRTLGKGEGQRPMLEMPAIAREEFGLDGIELVNQMLPSREPSYLKQFAAEAEKHNVRILLIMCDGEGNIGAESENLRTRAVENHRKWIDIAADFGCHSIRMNWGGAPKDVMQKPDLLEAFIARSVPGFQQLADYAGNKGLDVLIENHWGPSSYPDAVEKLMAKVNHPHFGVLPDFGNFPDEVDRYDAIDRLMVFAKKAVSFKCYDFDPQTGLDTKIDQERMIRIVHDKHGYHGYIGIEYEGSGPEMEGIRAAKALLEKLRGQA
jgi:sugar phosphate isomerase/epimerase